MQLKVDVKSLVAGLVLGVVVAVVLGADRGVVAGAGKADFGIAVPDEGTAVLKTDDGYLYLVSGDSGKAGIVVYDSGRYKGRPVNLRGLTGVEAPTKTYR